LLLLPLPRGPDKVRLQSHMEGALCPENLHPHAQMRVDLRGALLQSLAATVIHIQSTAVGVTASTLAPTSQHSEVPKQNLSFRLGHSHPLHPEAKGVDVEQTRRMSASTPRRLHAANLQRPVGHHEHHNVRRDHRQNPEVKQPTGESFAPCLAGAWLYIVACDVSACQ